MPFKLADDVLDTTLTAGTGSYTLSGTPPSPRYRSFLDGIGNGYTTIYARHSLTNYELGLGTLSGDTTLSRDFIITSTNGGAPVDWPVGGADKIYVTASAALAVVLSALLQAGDAGKLVKVNATADGFDLLDVADGSIAALGVNAAADTTNRVTVKSDAVLFSHDDVTPGTGNQHAVLNKSATSKEAGLVFQDDFGTRALIGLLGDDDLTVKVTPDGSSFLTSVTIDHDDGTVKFPVGIRDPNSGQLPTLMVPAVVKDIWRIDTNTNAATPRTYTISSVSGALLDLTTASVPDIFSNGMQNVTMVRIWNTSKVPAESAWVNWNNSATQLNVSNAADIATWANGETIRLGDPNPTGANVLNLIALDISNYMFNNFGVVWRQRGLKFSNAVQGVGGLATMNYSGTGAVGTAFGSSSNSDGVRQSTSVDVFTPIQSPISNSNLFFVGEAFTAPATALAATRLCRLIGIWV